MTSKQQSITSMISVVAEGRCALLATYQIFQFIVAYAMAQAFATNLMYTHALQMGNYQYLIGVSKQGGGKAGWLLAVCLCLHTAVCSLAGVHSHTASTSVAYAACG